MNFSSCCYWLGAVCYSFYFICEHTFNAIAYNRMKPYSDTFFLSRCCCRSFFEATQHLTKGIFERLLFDFVFSAQFEFALQRTLIFHSFFLVLLLLLVFHKKCFIYYIEFQFKSHTMNTVHVFRTQNAFSAVNIMRVYLFVFGNIFLVQMQLITLVWRPFYN